MPPYEQTNRSFENPYEAPEKIYEAFRNAKDEVLPAPSAPPTSYPAPAASPVMNLKDGNTAVTLAGTGEEKAVAELATLKSQLSTKQLKKLDRLQTKLDKRFQQKKQGSNSWFTPWTIIIALVAGAGLLLFLGAGWFFGLFLFILGGSALVCKAVGILDF